jgi:hypothetical protein
VPTILGERMTMRDVAAARSIFGRSTRFRPALFPSSIVQNSRRDTGRSGFARHRIEDKL